MRLRFTRIALLLVAFIAIFQGMDAHAGKTPAPHGVRDYAAGPAPLFTLANMDGAILSLKDSRGKWVFVHFWAS